MATDPRLERYLASLDRVLQPFPAGDRAEIILEIRSHVHAALERDPGANLDAVLAALGEPETVANRYLMERNLKPAKPPISPVVKWIINGFVITFALSLAFAAFVMVKFSPLVDIDEKAGRVTLLGGLIDIDQENGSGPTEGEEDEGADEADENADSTKKTVETRFTGALIANPRQEISVQFGNAKILVADSSDREFKWSCTGASPGKIAEPTFTPNWIRLDLGGTPWADCRLSIPRDGTIRLKGANGKLSFDQPRFAVSASLTNGIIDFAPAADRRYRYDVRVTTGDADTFKSAAGADAIPIALDVVNGKINRETTSSGQ